MQIDPNTRVKLIRIRPPLFALMVTNEEATLSASSEFMSTSPLPSTLLKPLTGRESIDHPRWTIRGYRAMHEIGHYRHQRSQNFLLYSKYPDVLYLLRSILLEELARLETEYKDDEPFLLAVPCPYCPPYSFPLETEF